MDLMVTIRKMQKALKYKYDIKTNIATYEYFSEKTGGFTHIYNLKVNGQKIVATNSKVTILLALKEQLEEAQNNGTK